MIEFFKWIWNLDRQPERYPPWDVRSGPDVFCEWLATGKDIRDNG